MARAINSQDTYRERLVKHFPSEISAAYFAATGMLLSMETPPTWALWVVFALCLAGVPTWLIFTQNVKSGLQNVLASVAFVLWAMTASGPFTQLDGYKPVIGSALLIVFSGVAAPLLGKFVKPT